MKLTKLILNNFRFFKGRNVFEIDGGNLVVYGENGSGKSSIFRAIELLATPKIDKEYFLKQKNIFSTQNPSLEFEFGDKKVLIDESNLENQEKFIKELSIYRPMLEYKHLLKIHYQTDKSKEEINIYDMLREIFKEYPLDDGVLLGDIKNPDKYFDTLKELLNGDILERINYFLSKFDTTFKLHSFHFDKEFSDDGRVEFIINVKVDYFNHILEKYHNFLNEAKLSALAMAIYLVIIRDISDRLNSSLKILILDDLLISLDMNNRLSLIEILKEYFKDFQLFFFTHDKALFDIFKDKILSKAYEVYISDDEFETPFIKKSNSPLDQAKYHFIKKNYSCSANLLRQCLEKLMCKILPPSKLVNKNCKSLDLSALVTNGISFVEDNEIREILIKLQTFRQILFNVGSHYSDINIYKKDLNEAIEYLEKLKRKIV